MFIPTTPCVIYQTKRDRYGQEVLQQPAQPAKCSVINFFSRVEKTSVRTDSSGSKGAADENTADVRLMFSVGLKDLIVKDACIILFNEKLRVWRVFPRQDVTGRHHHIQVDCVAWQ